MKTEIKETGLYANGLVKSLKMTTAGQMQDGTEYGNSLKIKIEFPIKTIKKVANEEIEIEDLIVIEQKIRFGNQEKMLEKYKEFQTKKGQNMLFKFNPKLKDGDTFWAEIIENEIRK